ncbi:hypothetical protein [Bifidobacterium dentium]|uniref:hypothetical protein n=1 Tax=Bifidobacterium dentium TaxID=1689 RepID=UPI0018B0C435|nr:hypothetical protein [Bifidobacterium dentium]MBF9693919.1 hypothetical protein [Bifidobacterium dentium]
MIATHTPIGRIIVGPRDGGRSMGVSSEIDSTLSEPSDDGWICGFHAMHVSTP